ncbi:MAG TPA: hypothetical protein VF345_12500 [Chthoniobacterales bacterium]
MIAITTALLTLSCIRSVADMPMPTGALSDTKFRGRYDLRVHWGYVLEKKRVDLPVPKNVSITLGQPAVSKAK